MLIFRHSVKTFTALKNIFSETVLPPLHIYITYVVFGSTGPRGKKIVETVHFKHFFSLIPAHFTLRLAGNILYFLSHYPSFKLGAGYSKYIVLSVWLLITIHEDGEQILCSEGLRNEFLKRQKLLKTMKRKSFQYMKIVFLSIQSLTVSLKKRMRMIISQLQEKPVRSQPVSIQDQAVSSQQVEKYGCQKIIKLNFCPRNEPPRMATNVIRMQPVPTGIAVTHVQDIKSSFELFILDSIKKIILDFNNLEGQRVLG